MLNKSDRFWTERSVPGSPSWPFFRGRTLSRYRFACSFARHKRVLDIASGTGHGSHLLATEGAANEVVGVDISRDAVRYAASNYAGPNIRYVHGDAQRLLDSEIIHFDLVTSMGTLEHIENPDLFAQQILQVLAPGGIWLVTMLNPAAHEGIDPYHYQEWNADQFRVFLERNRFRFELRWHVTLPAGVEKAARNRRRYGFLPAPLKSAVKQVIGRRAALQIARIGATFCEPEDFTFSRAPVDNALEFLAICRKQG